MIPEAAKEVELFQAGQDQEEAGALRRIRRDFWPGSDWNGTGIVDCSAGHDSWNDKSVESPLRGLRCKQGELSSELGC
jgi:hypothetical protein